MDYNKAFEVQKQVRDNAKTFNSYLTDLQNWEAEMKRKEAALNGEFEQDLPPVRSKVKKERPVQAPRNPEKRIPSSDYKAWEKFDVDKACEEIEIEDKGPTSLDSKKSLPAKMEKLREEAQYEKERGNNFVKQEKWDEAIKCYNRAIELVKDDAIYYANRGLCYLKKESLHQASADCTEALRLDPTYVKALQRRATAREKLGSLRAASQDLSEVLKLEPHNKAAKVQLDAIRARMGTKGSKSKSSPVSTPTIESKPIVSKPKTQPKIVELPDKPKPVSQSQPTVVDNWRHGVGENVTVMRPVKKPPHLRSKRSLKSIPIQEIQLGKTSPEKPPTRIKIVEIEDQSQGDTNKDCKTNIEGIPEKHASSKFENTANKDCKTNIEGSPEKHASSKFENTGKGDVASPESVKLITDSMVMEKDNRVANLLPPVSSVQFMAQWKYLRGNDEARSDYLSVINPAKIPSIFANALESDVLSDVIRLLAADPSKFRGQTVSAYLSGLSRVKRFSALAMFLSDTDKLFLTKLLNHCRTVEKCSDSEIDDLKNKYEL